MESIYSELALYGSKNERARTDTKVDLHVAGASKSAIEAVEKAGGSVTVKALAAAAAE